MATQPITYRLVLSGYYGYRNSGDEAVLQSILLALEEQGKRAGVRIEPIVLSIDPAWTSHMYGVRAVHRMRLREVVAAIRESDGLISGGGSLLQDVTGWKTIPYYLAILKLTQWFGKPTFIYSQGIGPVRRSGFFGWIRHVFNRSAYISVRDEESAELLAMMGVNRNRVQVVPDPVMGMPLAPTEDIVDKHEAKDRIRPIVGISVRYWNGDHSELHKLAEVARKLIGEHQVDIRFLPFHLPSDEQASRDIIAAMGNTTDRVTIAEEALHPQQMLAEVSRCDLLIGMRLHSLIYAASQSVPMVGISYDPKIDQFLARIGMKPAASTSSFSVDEVLETCLLLLNTREEWQATRQPVIDQLKQQAQQPAQQIIEQLRKGSR
jgi:polysaccharide pyruvyl transferase CsaB